MKLSILSLSCSIALMSASAMAQHSSFSSGNMSFRSDGVVSINHGSFSTHSNGTTSINAGSLSIHSDGSTSQRIGTMSLHSNGSSTYHYGLNNNSDGSSLKSVYSSSSKNNKKSSFDNDFEYEIEDNEEYNAPVVVQQAPKKAKSYGNQYLKEAVRLAHIRNEDSDICEEEAYEYSVIENLRLALKSDKKTKELMKKDADLQKALSHSLVYKELIGEFGPKLNNIDISLSKARFEEPAQGVFGSLRKVQLNSDYTTSERIITFPGDTYKIKTVKGTWSIISRTENSMKVKIGKTTYTLKKIDSEYILIAPGEEGQVYKTKSLYNSSQGECEA